MGERRPAYYAARGRLGDWWTVLHPPYTLWHLSYVVIGASLAPELDVQRLAATLVAFFLAVGIAAHALDELHGRPLRTRIPSAALVAASVVALLGAVALGVAGITRVGWGLTPFIVVGVVLVCAYNLEWFGGAVHTTAGFATAWGAFPVLVAYFAQAERIDAAAVAAAAAAFGLSWAQRTLSTPARLLRRRAEHVDGSIALVGGESRRLDTPALLAPLEGALRALSWSTVALAIALVVSRLM